MQHNRFFVWRVPMRVLTNNNVCIHAFTHPSKYFLSRLDYLTSALVTHFLFFNTEISDILAILQGDIHRPEKRTSSPVLPRMTSPCLLLVIKTWIDSTGNMSKIFEFQSLSHFSYFTNTCCICRMCHSIACPTVGSVTEH